MWKVHFDLLWWSLELSNAPNLLWPGVQSYQLVNNCALWAQLLQCINIWNRFASLICNKPKISTYDAIPDLRNTSSLSHISIAWICLIHRLNTWLWECGILFRCDRKRTRGYRTTSLRMMKLTNNDNNQTTTDDTKNTSDTSMKSTLLLSPFLFGLVVIFQNQFTPH